MDTEYAGTMEEPAATMTTHLADRYPQIDTPLRVEPPAIMKAPERTETLSRDAHIRRSAYSPRAYATRACLMERVACDPGGAEQLLEPGVRSALRRELPGQTALGPFKTEIANYATLAFSSRRAHKAETEAQAYFSIGVLHDNVGQFHAALESYRQFRETAVAMRDPVAEALASNCMGVDCMLSACPPSAAAGFGAAQLSEQAQASLRRAVDFHEQHLKIADDGGSFVASTNLGLCHGALGDALAAARHHQDALRVAIALQSFSGQSISVGNLGSLAMRQGDYATAKPCLEQHLQLVQNLQDQGAEVHAYMQLGHLALAQDDHANALEHFEHAGRIAGQLGEQGTLKRANCYIGLAKGKLTMDTMFSAILENIQAV